MTDSDIKVAVSCYLFAIDRLVVTESDFEQKVLSIHKHILRTIHLVQFHTPSFIEHVANECKVLRCIEVRGIVFYQAVALERINLFGKVKVFTKPRHATFVAG